MNKDTKDMIGIQLNTVNGCWATDVPWLIKYLKYTFPDMGWVVNNTKAIDELYAEDKGE